MSNQNYQPQQYGNFQQYAVPAAKAELTDRLSFIRRTYLHLAGAILAFIGIETLIFGVFGDQIAGSFAANMSGMNWLIVLGLFMGANWLANYWAHSDANPALQYAGLGLLVVAESIIFIPILYIAKEIAPGSIGTAAMITAIVFIGLTVTVFVTKVDFSFLRMVLVVGSLAAMAAIVAGILFSLPIFGALFAGLMVALAAGYILYDTSNVLHHYRTDQHVAASLALFSSIALLFWYVLRLVLAFAQE